MGIYRQSIWKANSTQARFLPLVYTYAFVLIITIDSGYTFILVTSLGCFIIFLGLIFATTLFYIIITSKGIRLKNPVYRFWHSEFCLSEIEKVVLGYEGGFTSYYIQIFYCGKKSYRYVIDLVNRKQYKDLIAELEAKGVKVELKNVKIR